MLKCDEFPLSRLKIFCVALCQQPITKIMCNLRLQIITIRITQFHFSSITISSYQTKPVIVHAYWDYPYSLSTQFFSSLEYFKECISQLYMFKIHYYYIYFIIFIISIYNYIFIYTTFIMCALRPALMSVQFDSRL